MFAKIKVVVRIRPATLNEVAHDSIQVLDKSSLTFIPPKITSFANSNKKLNYSYDHVFDAESTQEEIYNAYGKPLISHILEGNNAAVFAYGATGSGKTTTMLGDDKVGKGLIWRAFEELWDAIDGMPEYELKASFVEIYNEAIYDLLSNEKDMKLLTLRRDENGNEVICGAQMVQVRNFMEINRLLEKANSKRKVESTVMNDKSSRSHAILRIILKKNDGKTVKENSLLLLDLAGSERAVDSKNTPSQFRDAAHINRGLLSLANCLKAMADKSSFVKFRDSLLTRVLKDCLTNPSTETIMIANVSPSLTKHQDSFHTLEYAQTCRQIRVQNVKDETVAENFLKFQNYVHQMKIAIEQRRIAYLNRKESRNITIENHFEDDENHILSIVDDDFSKVCDPMKIFLDLHIDTITKVRSMVEAKYIEETRLHDLRDAKLLRLKMCEKMGMTNNPREFGLLENQILECEDTLRKINERIELEEKKFCEQYRDYMQNSIKNGIVEKTVAAKSIALLSDYFISYVSHQHSFYLNKNSQKHVSNVQESFKLELESFIHPSAAANILESMRKELNEELEIARENHNNLKSSKASFSYQ
jgi:hypothetical protein